jgi:hypothetical protein
MKQKIADYLLIFLILCLTAMFGYSLYQNSKLENVIENQNTFIMEVTGKQSKFDKESKEYRDSLTSYSKEISFRLNGNKLTSDQFVKAYDKLADERDSIIDANRTLKLKYDLAQDIYGFKIKVTETKTKVFYSAVPYTKADSAETALWFFKDRLKITKKGWTADITGPKEVAELEKSIRKVGETSKKIVDSAAKNN